MIWRSSLEFVIVVGGRRLLFSFGKKGSDGFDYGNSFFETSKQIVHAGGRMREFVDESLGLIKYGVGTRNGGAKIFDKQKKLNANSSDDERKNGDDNDK